MESTLPFLFLALLEQELKKERIKGKGKDSFVSAFSDFLEGFVRSLYRVPL